MHAQTIPNFIKKRMNVFFMKDQYQLIYCFHKIYISLQLFLQIPDHYTSLHSFVWLRSELMIKLQLTVTFCEPASVLVSRV